MSSFIMDVLSADDKAVIKRYPIGESLKPVAADEPIPEEYHSMPEFSRLAPQVMTIRRLQNLEAAQNLKSRVQNKSLGEDLDQVVAFIWETRPQPVSCYRTWVLDWVRSGEQPEQILWGTIIISINSTLLTIEKSLSASLGRPPSSSSAPVPPKNFPKAWDAAKLLETGEILEQYRDVFYYTMDGFHDRHFQNKEWSDVLEVYWQRLCVEYDFDQGKWPFFPDSPTSDNASVGPMFDSWAKLDSDRLRTFSSYIMGRSDIAGTLLRPDILVEKSIRAPYAPSRRVPFKGVVGVVKDPDESWVNLDLRLAACVARALAVQSSQSQIHGFTLAGNLMRCWVFDRFGAYNSGTFDIHKNPRRFVEVYVGYLLMTNADLGLGVYAEEDDLGN